MYVYEAKLVKVIDGDTWDFDLDLGLETHRIIRVRASGINAAEHGTPLGDAARSFVDSWFQTHGSESLIVRTIKDHTEKYGRYLADVTAADGHSLVPDLIAAGYAVAWDGKGPRPLPPGPVAPFAHIALPPGPVNS